MFLHGGPSGGSELKQGRFFHPAKYRIVNSEQRGCSKSTPYASLEANTTWDLVADIEKIRDHLASSASRASAARNSSPKRSF